MPPIKGRMMSRMGGQVPSVTRDTKDVRNAKKVTVHQKKWKNCSPVKSENGQLPANITQDEQLMKLRMPNEIVRILPSVKKYQGVQNFVDLTDNISVSSESDLVIDEDPPCSSSQLIGHRRGRGHSKYTMRLLAHEKFNSMIWDVSVSPQGQVFVSCSDGVYVCDQTLSRSYKLDKILLPGGVDFLSNGTIVALCRNNDTVNFFTKAGVFIKAFNAGFSPMGIIVNGKDTLVITDPGEKCIHVFDTCGKELHKIQTEGTGYKLQWPLYVSAVDEQSFIVSDCHAQKVHKFLTGGRHLSTYKLKTPTGHEVLRPHGLCVYQEEDVFVIDTALDSIEVFTWDDTFVQTLISHDEGITIKPKCLRLNKQGNTLVIGGRTGVVRVYQFVDTPSCTPIKQEVKAEVKQEVSDISDVIVLE